MHETIPLALFRMFDGVLLMILSVGVIYKLNSLGRHTKKTIHARLRVTIDGYGFLISDLFLFYEVLPISGYIYESC